MSIPIIDRFEGEHAFLSNFHPGGPNTVEHGFQANKTLDSGWFNRILAAPTPGKAKRLGRKAPLRPDWENVKVPVMLDLLRVKFSVPALRERLLATGNAELIEGNTWHDNFWGDCTCGRPECQEPGNNTLGDLLMQVRAEIREAM